MPSTQTRGRYPPPLLKRGLGWTERFTMVSTPSEPPPPPPPPVFPFESSKSIPRLVWSENERKKRKRKCGSGTALAPRSRRIARIARRRGLEPQSNRFRLGLPPFSIRPPEDVVVKTEKEKKGKSPNRGSRSAAGVSFSTTDPQNHIRYETAALDEETMRAVFFRFFLSFRATKSRERRAGAFRCRRGGATVGRVLDFAAA